MRERSIWTTQWNRSGQHKKKAVLQSRPQKSKGARKRGKRSSTSWCSKRRQKDSINGRPQSTTRLKQINLADFNTLIQSRCINQKWKPPEGWNGHPNHQMWEKGTQVYCQLCNGKATYQEEKWQASQKLQKPCKAQEEKQPSLSAFFNVKQGR